MVKASLITPEITKSFRSKTKSKMNKTKIIYTNE